MERKNGSGQDARATVVGASCPEPSIAKLSANRTVLGGPPVPHLLRRLAAALVEQAGEEPGDLGQGVGVDRGVEGLEIAAAFF